MPVIPDEALNSHAGILGKTGSGKTFTAKGLVERLLTAKRQVVIIDPTGAWWGLRSGFDIPIFGGRHGDMDISDAAGDAVATVVIEQRTSAIIDLSLMSGGAQRRFMRGFAHRLRGKPPGAFWLVIDEADEFLPQQLSPDMTNLFGDLKWMVRRGRLNGFRVIMITQRPAEIAKAVLTQIETLVAHRLTAPQDRKAIEEWVKGHHAPEEAREVLSTLASLDKGEAWVWAPDLGILKRAHMPAIATFDSGRTPEQGEADLAPPKLSRLNFSGIAAAIAAATAEDKPKGSKITTMPSWPDQREEVARLRVEAGEARKEGERVGIAIGITRAQQALVALRVDAPQESARPGQGSAREAVSPARRVPEAASQSTRKSDGELNAAAIELAALLKGVRAVMWDSLLIMGGFRPGSGWIRKARKDLVAAELIIDDPIMKPTQKLLDDSSITAKPQPTPAALRALWTAKLRGPGGTMAVWLVENGPATREEVAAGVGMSPTAGWSRKGFKDLLGSNLARVEGSKLVPHPLLVG